MTGQADPPGDEPEGPDTRISPPAILRTLIVGAGQAGRALARDLCADERHGLRPIGFVDDAREAGTGTALPLLGTTADLARLVTEHRAEAVALAIPDLPPARIHELTDAAIGAGAVARYLPWHTAASSREAAGADLRPLDIRALIDGPRPHVVWPEVKEIITGKRILVTGADGPLGSEICRQLQAFNPDALFLLDIDQDQDKTDQTFRELTPEVVFHAGSLRHPSVLERRPSHGVKANILSTDNLVRAATRYGSERFVLISTDADPASMLGASHRVAEAIVRAAAYKAKSGKPGPQAVFAAVRIGDVLDTRDSLLTLLADQIRAGGPVTITHPDATRCFATVEEAVALALDAGHTATGGEVYTLDLGEPTRVIDVVSRFTRQYKLPEVPIRYVGVRLPQRKDPRPTERIPTPQPQIFTTPTDADPTGYARLPERLDKLYKAAAKNRDPKVRQMLLKLAEASSDKTG